MQCCCRVMVFNAGKLQQVCASMLGHSWSCQHICGSNGVAANLNVKKGQHVSGFRCTEPGSCRAQATTQLPQRIWLQRGVHLPQKVVIAASG